MNSQRVLPKLAVCSAILICPILSGCQTSGQVLQRSLPSRLSVIADPTPRPTIRRGDDARLVARKALTYGDANATKLEDAAENYDRLSATYAGE